MIRRFGAVIKSHADPNFEEAISNAPVIGSRTKRRGDDDTITDHFAGDASPINQKLVTNGVTGISVMDNNVIQGNQFLFAKSRFEFEQLLNFIFSSRHPR